MFILKFLKKPLFSILCAIIIFVLFFYQISLNANYQQSTKDINKYIAQWKYEISENLFQNKNRELITKLIQGLQAFPVSQYEVLEGNSSVLSWPEQLPTLWSACHTPISSPLTLRGLQLGTVKLCLSDKRISQATLLSPLFILVIAFVVLLLIFSAFFPLFGYKRALTSTLRVLKKWTHHPEEALNVDHEDKIANDLINLVKQGIQSRIELKDVHLALDAEKKVSKITKQVAHDIRSPVMSLNIALHTCDLQIPEPASSIISSSIDRILETSDDLLKTNRKNSYRLNQMTATLINPLIIDVINDKTIIHQNIQFITNIEENLNALCSPMDFKRVLSNLINNSIEAIESPEAIIQCRAINKGGSCQLSLSDNGKGISAKNLSHIFDENFTHGKNSGNGLGLHYVQSKVTEWGGSINVQSTLNQGTQFEIQLQCPVI